MSTAVISQPSDSILSTALTPNSVVAQVRLIQEVMSNVMQDGEHYGTIPGCGTKKVLMKSGAEKLCFTFQLVPTFAIERTELPNGHREYEIVTTLATRSGIVVGQGVGTCSSMEPKYRYRTAGRKCPTCGKESIVKVNKGRNPGSFWCVPDKGGCNANFPPGDPKVEGQQAGKAENPDPAEQFNTILKMAKKRSLVDATITACAASDCFTQDLEELPQVEEEPVRAQKVATVTGEILTKKPEWNAEQTARGGEYRARIMEIGGDKGDERLRAIFKRMKYDQPDDVLNAVSLLLREYEEGEPVIVEGGEQ